MSQQRNSMEQLGTKGRDRFYMMNDNELKRQFKRQNRRLKEETKENRIEFFFFQKKKKGGKKEGMKRKQDTNFNREKKTWR